MSAEVPTGEADSDAVDPLAAQQRLDRREVAGRTARHVVVLVAFLVLLAALYTGYKWFGASVDHAQTDWPIIGSYLPRSGDRTMPPLSEIAAAYTDIPGSEDQAFGLFLLQEALFTLRSAFVGFVAGALIGLTIAIVLLRAKIVERAMYPYIILSQTIPLIAIAPIIVIGGRKNLDWLPWEWQDWMSVAVIATYLTFFPVAVNGLRGLQSAEPDQVELMDSYASSWGQTLRRLRFPASVPYLFAAFKIAATAAVVGAIVGEISGGVRDGLGRRILLEATQSTSGAQRLYASVLVAAALGVLVFSAVAALERVVLRKQHREAVL